MAVRSMREDAIDTIRAMLSWGAAEYDSTCGPIYQKEMQTGRDALASLGVTEEELIEHYDSKD